MATKTSVFLKKCQQRSVKKMMGSLSIVEVGFYEVPDNVENGTRHSAAHSRREACAVRS